MNDDELKQMADLLDEAIIGSNPQSRIFHGVPFHRLALNREGCLAFAANLLHVASQPIEENSTPANSMFNLEQILESETDVKIFRLQRVDHFDIDEPEEIGDVTWRDRLSLATCALIAFALLATFLGGVWFWISLFFF